MATNYSRGYSAENKCANELKEQGWLAMRTAGSHGPADVVAVSDTGIVAFIQVKSVQNVKDVEAVRRQATGEIVRIKDRTLWCGRVQQVVCGVWVRVHGQKGWAVKEFV